MKRILYYLIFFAFTCFTNNTYANRLFGGEFTYQSTSNPNIYNITFKYYRNCSGAPLCNCPGGPVNSNCTITANVSGGSPNCLGTSYGTITLTIAPNSGVYDIVQLCDTSKSICTNCGTRTPGSFTTGVEVFTFTGTINFSLYVPLNCCLVNIGYSECCRDSFITTLTNPLTTNFYIGTTINRCVSNNSSPVFNNPPDFLFQAGADKQLDFSASDPNGDSISYEYTSTRSSVFASAIYAAPYSSSVPFPYLGAPGGSPPLVPPFGIDSKPINGIIRFRPFGNFRSSIAIQVKKWRLVNNTMTMIGSVTRDIHVRSLVFPNITGSVLNIVAYDQNGLLTTNTTQIIDTICIGSSICRIFSAQSLPPTDTTDLNTSKPPFVWLPNFSKTKLYDTTTRSLNGPRFDSIKICWTPNASQISSNPYVLLLTGKNRSCPMQLTGYKSWSIFVKSSNNTTINSIATITKKVTGLLSRKLTYTRNVLGHNDKNLTYWSIETSPGSNSYTIVNGDSINNYVFPQAGTYKIKLALVSICSMNTINDSLTVGGFRLMVNEQKSIRCINAATGAIRLGAVGGIGPYQFKLNNGTYSSIDSFTNLTAGNYWVYARDTNNLRDSLLITLFQPANGLSLYVINKKNVTCNGDSNATVSIGIIGYFGKALYKLDNGPFQDTSYFSNLYAGQKIFYVQDSLNCLAGIQVNVTQPAPITFFNSISSNIACKGDSNASVSISVNGGNGSFTFRRDTTQPFVSNPFFTGLNAGQKFFQVRDILGCLKSGYITITEANQKLIANINVTQPICSNSKGIVQINATGGNTPYIFGILNGQSGSNNTINNLNPGTYSFFVLDSNYCQINFNNIIINPATSTPLSLLSTSKNVTCFGANNGEIKLIPSGGKAPYLYKLDTAAYKPDSIYTNLFAKTYAVSVLDSNQCLASSSITITQPSSMTLSINSFSNIPCKGDSNGSVFLSVSGGKTPYTFRVDSGTYQTSSNFLGLKAGNKLFQVRDSNACVKNLSFTISEPTNALSSSLVINQPNCNQAKGQALFSANGGTPPYLYGIVNGSSSNSSTINNINPGTYTFYVKDDNNCQLLLPNRTILSAPPILNFSFSKKDVFCAGSNTGEIAISGTGGKAPYTFRINAGTYQSDSSFKNLSAGKYRITIRDSVACVFSDSILINQNAPIQINVNTTSKIACKGDSSAAIVINASNGYGSYLFSLNNSTFQTGNSFNNLNAGLKNIRVKDSTNCINTINYNIIEPVLKLTVSPLVNQAICSNDKASIVLNTSGGKLPYSYALNNGTPSSNNNFNNLNPGNYSLMVKDSNNCIINLERTINAPLSNLQTTISSKDLSCFGLNNGEISISAFSGKKPYSFKLNNGNYLNDSIFKNLSAGNYSISTKDSFGCITTGTKTISQPNKISTKITATPTSCLGAKNGAASITVSGGKSPYTINWLSNPNQTGTFAANLESGLLRVVVQDSASCLAIDSIDIPYLPTFGDENICAVTCDTNLSRYKLVWNKTPNKGIASYQVFRGNTLIRTIPFSSNPLFVDSNFSLPTNGIAPSYYLKSVDSCGLSSDLSDETKPILMSATVSAGNVNLSWTPYTGTQVPTSYYVYRKIGNGSALAVSQVTNGNLNYTDTFSGNQNRSYLIEANFAQSCVSGVRVLSNPLYVFANSIDELNQISREYLLFPNPSSSFVNITNKKGLASIKSLQVTDISGKIIEQMNYDKAQSEIKLDIQYFANGSYFVILILDNGMKVNLPLQKRL